MIEGVLLGAGCVTTDRGYGAMGRGSVTRGWVCLRGRGRVARVEDRLPGHCASTIAVSTLCQ